MKRRPLQWIVALAIALGIAFGVFGANLWMATEQARVRSLISQARSAPNPRKFLEDTLRRRGQPLDYAEGDRKIGYYYSKAHFRPLVFQSLSFTVSVHFRGDDISTWDTIYQEASP